MTFLSKYGAARHIYIPMVKRAVVDHAVGADWTPAAGDVKISKDGGAAANVTNLPVAIAMGNSALWDFSLTATEMQAAQIAVTIADSATKAVEDSGFVIETYGHASAQHAVDLDDGVRAGLTALPNAAADAAGGLPISDAGGLDLDARLDAAVSTRLASASYTAPPSAASIRAEMDANSTDLDAIGVLATGIKAKTDNLPASPAAVGSAMTLASGAIDSAAIAAAAANKIADHILRRALASALASSDGDTKTFRSLAGAIAKLVNRIVSSGGTLTIYEPDDTTSLGTQALTTDAAAEPIVEANTV